MRYLISPHYSPPPPLFCTLLLHINPSEHPLFLSIFQTSKSWDNSRLSLRTTLLLHLLLPPRKSDTSFNTFLNRSLLLLYPYLSHKFQNPYLSSSLGFLTGILKQIYQKNLDFCLQICFSIEAPVSGITIPKTWYYPSLVSFTWTPQKVSQEMLATLSRISHHY